MADTLDWPPPRMGDEDAKAILEALAHLTETTAHLANTLEAKEAESGSAQEELKAAKAERDAARDAIAKFQTRAFWTAVGFLVIAFGWFMKIELTVSEINRFGYTRPDGETARTIDDEYGRQLRALERLHNGN